MGKNFLGLDGLKHFWTKAKTWIAGQITAEVTAKIAEIVANAPEDLDTLKEIADWISAHADDAAAMNTQITENKNEISSLKTTVAGKASSDHTHDDRYYTESEVDTKLSGKSDTGHTHTKSEITDFAHTHDYWPRSIQTLDLSSLDESLYYPCVAKFNTTGFARLQVDVHLNSGTKPSWSTHNNGFSCHFDILTNPSGWGASSVTRIILKDDFAWANLNPVGWSQMTNSSVAVLWLRGGGKYYITKDYFGDFLIQTSAYTTNNQSVAPRSDRVLEGNTLVADRAYKDGNGNNIAGTYMPKSVIAPQGYVAKTYYIKKIPSLSDMTAEQEQLLAKMFMFALGNRLINIRGIISFTDTSGNNTYAPIVSYLYTDYEGFFTINNDNSFSLSSDFYYNWFTVLCAQDGTDLKEGVIYIKDLYGLAGCFVHGDLSRFSNFSAYELSFTLLEKI